MGGQWRWQCVQEEEAQISTGQLHCSVIVSLCFFIVFRSFPYLQSQPITGSLLQFIVEFPQKISHKQLKALDIILRKDPDDEPDTTATATTIYQLEHVFSPPTQRFYEDISAP